MFRRPEFLIAIIVAAGLSLTILPIDTAKAQPNGVMVSDANAWRSDLKVQWESQLAVGPPHTLLDWAMVVDEDQMTTWFTMESGNLKDSVSNRDLNPQGVPYGIDGAKAEMDLRAEILEERLKFRGIKDIKIQRDSYSLPATTIYTLCTDGLISAIDADTGVHRWDHSIVPHLRVLGMGASKKHIAVVIGSTVYCLRAADGKELWQRKTIYAPSASPAISETHVLVPLANGRLQAFNIEAEGLGPNNFFATGFASSRPLVTNDGVAWVTDAGQMNYATPDTSTAVNFRLQARSPLISSPTILGDRIFVASARGTLFCIDVNKGIVLWEVTTEGGVSQSPLPFGDSVYVVTDTRQLYRVNPETGVFVDTWQKPIENMERIVAASKTKLYMIDPFNNLVVLDQKTGSVVSKLRINSVDKVLHNNKTDRMYLASNEGLVQSVRDINSKLPYFHDSSFEKSAAASDGEGRPGPDDQPDSAPTNPFGGGAAPAVSNPFGSPSSDADSNPFGGPPAKTDAPADTSNPFATGGDSSNPFGDASPFGGGGGGSDDNPFE